MTQMNLESKKYIGQIAKTEQFLFFSLVLVIICSIPQYNIVNSLGISNFLFFMFVMVWF